MFGRLEGGRMGLGRRFERKDLRVGEVGEGVEGRGRIWGIGIGSCLFPNG